MINPADLSLQALACLDAVASEGGFQAAAARLHRTHSAVFAAVRQLEARAGVALLDRSGYRVSLTEAGRAFHARARSVLAEAAALAELAGHLQRGEETDLRVVIGDLTPTARLLPQLKRFFSAWPRTRLHLHFEALGGPGERLLAGDADLIVHFVDRADPRLEWTKLLTVTLVPVVAPGFLPFPLTRSLTPAAMKDLVQCILRDSAAQPGPSYHVIPGARSWTVADQQTKKELILRGMGWGHMPLHLVERELRSGKLLSIEGRHFKRSRMDIVAARRRDRPVGPVAARLWEALAAAAD
ncbi:MAG TPA: LysR family transcriptional regulator [Burkholderiaceae bacterium]